MKIKRFVASNMRQALQMVRKEQGPNAVILSNRRAEKGIEVVAAVDYDETLFNQSYGSAHNNEEPSSEEPANEYDEADTDSSSVVSARDRSNDPDSILQGINDSSATRDESQPSDPMATESDSKSTTTQPLDTVLAMDTRFASADATLSEMRHEMRQEMHDIRTLLTDQLSSLAWNDEARRDPATVSLLRQFAAFGLDSDVARQVVNAAIDNTAAAKHLDRGAQLLAQSLPIYQNDLLEQGGVVAVVGPTGVGKTTTIAKLAARFSMRHGRDQIALVSTDSFRIGAQEQLATFAQILDVPVHLVRDKEDLSLILASLKDKRLVLIDTAGVSQRAQGLSNHLKTFGGEQKVKMFLALAANGDSHTLDEVVREFGQVPLDGCILSKVDEAASFGPCFSTAIRHKLPIAYFANGQRVPEDLHTAKSRAMSMVNYGMKLKRESRLRVDEEFMARNFGEVSTHAYA